MRLKFAPYDTYMSFFKHIHTYMRGPLAFIRIIIWPVFSYKNQNSKKNFRHLHGDLNLDKIKKRIATAICKWRDESNEPN